MTIINIPFIKTDSVIFFDRSIPQTCKAIHSLVIDLLKIPNWIIRKQHIANQLGVSLRTVNRYFNLLVKLGYAYYDDIKHRWHVFRTPKPNKAATSTGGGLPHLVAINQIDNYPEENTTTASQIPEEQKAVVVFEEIKQQVDAVIIPSLVTPELIEEDQDVLVYPAQLDTVQKKAAKVQIKKAPIDLQQAILACLAHYMIQGTVKNPIGYLKTLVAAANNGTFDVLGAAGAPIPDRRHIDATQEQIKAYQAQTLPEPEKRGGIMAELKAALRGIA